MDIFRVKNPFTDILLSEMLELLLCQKKIYFRMVWDKITFASM